MWQVLLAAAAAAGSGILAKKLINPAETETPISGENGETEGSTSPFNDEEKRDGEIFRFSSFQTESEMKKNKTGSMLKKKNGDRKRGKKSGGEKEVGGSKRISVCLKKRRTGKNVAGKCESCSSKDNSFGWGVGIGIMYMMSSGKAEISRLNCSMDETAKIVQELKDEISRRKNSCNEGVTSKKHIESSHSYKSKYKMKRVSASYVEDDRRGSSVLTEAERPEVLEMDQLEAELESELQKLPWCGTGSSGSAGRSDVFEAKEQNSKVCQYGVLPDELDKKLSDLLIEQQENQIVDLEAELNQAHTKLQQKEAELQALRSCVKRLGEFSLATVSDEEVEKNEDWVADKQEMEPAESMVGMKRAIGYETHLCSSE